MAISPEYVGLLQIGIRSSSEWTEAWDRINDYLDALKAPGGDATTLGEGFLPQVRELEQTPLRRNRLNGDDLL